MQPAAMRRAGAPSRARERMLVAEITQLKNTIDGLRDEIRGKNGEIRDLRAQNASLVARLAGRPKRTKRTWPELLRSYLRNDHPDKTAYMKIWRLCCREENMSAKVEVVHPDLKLVASRRRRRRVDSDAEDGSDDSNTDDESDVALENPFQNNTTEGQDESPQNTKPFPFDRLPGHLQAEILRLVLHKQGEIIHCLSRLDPFVQPEEIPTDEELGEFNSGLIRRFYWGRRACSITDDGVDPQKVLAPLSVSRRFYFLGVHIFYSLNTFSFSSLGELGRFCTGSGLARVARIQHVELLLTGSQRLTCPPDTRNRVPMSRRTYPLSWFLEMYRLKTLVIHVNETGKDYIRRGYENASVKQVFDAKTRGQPNQRMSRALRCLQGIDNVYQLRGLDWIRFYDFQKVLKSRRSRRVEVQDWSFLQDIARLTTMPKPPQREESSQLEKLAAVLAESDQGWNPGAEDWELVKSFFIQRNGRCSYDDMRIRRRNRDADIVSYLSVDGTMLSGDTSSRETDSDGSDDPDSGSDRGPKARARARKRHRPRSKSPLFFSDGNSITDSDEPLGSSSHTGSSSTDSDSDSSDAETDLFGSILSSSGISASGLSDSSSSGSDASDSDPDSSGSSANLTDEILSRYSSSRTPSVSPSQISTPRSSSSSSSSASTSSPTNTNAKRNQAPSTPRPLFKKRESTGLFVTPGPPNPNRSPSGNPQTPAPVPQTPAQDRARHTWPETGPTRGSAAPGMFVTPGPPNRDRRRPMAAETPGDGESGSPRSEGNLEKGSHTDAGANPLELNAGTDGDEMALDKTGGNKGVNGGFKALEAIFEGTTDAVSEESGSEASSGDDGGLSDDEDGDDDSDDGTDNDEDGVEDDVDEGGDLQKKENKKGRKGVDLDEDMEDEDDDGEDTEMESASDNDSDVPSDDDDSDAGSDASSRSDVPPGLLDSDTDSDGDIDDNLVGSAMDEDAERLGGASGLKVGGGGSLKRARSSLSDGGSSGGKRSRGE